MPGTALLPISFSLLLLCLVLSFFTWCFFFFHKPSPSFFLLLACRLIPFSSLSYPLSWVYMPCFLSIILRNWLNRKYLTLSYFFFQFSIASPHVPFSCFPRIPPVPLPFCVLPHSKKSLGYLFLYVQRTCFMC